MDKQLTLAQVAARINVSIGTARNYRQDGFLPPADGYLGNRPWWRAATIDEWQAARPGRGRPRRNKKSPRLQ